MERLDCAAPTVLALPRGGVPVAFEVAQRLAAPLDVLIACKVGAPHQPELGIGAVAEGGGSVTDPSLIRALGVSDATLERLVANAHAEVGRRVAAYRGGRALPPIEGRDVLLVDDGVATGATAEAALRSIRQHGPDRLILAVPTCSPSAVTRLGAVADEVVSVLVPHDLVAVGQWYDDFTQTSDDEVRELLAAGRAGERP